MIVRGTLAVWMHMYPAQPTTKCFQRDNEVTVLIILTGNIFQSDRSPSECGRIREVHCGKLCDAIKIKKKITSGMLPAPADTSLKNNKAENDSNIAPQHTTNELKTYFMQPVYCY